jgi:hypothetical protein
MTFMAGGPQGPPAFYLITDPFDSLLPKPKTMKNFYPERWMSCAACDGCLLGIGSGGGQAACGRGFQLPLVQCNV